LTLPFDITHICLGYPCD